ncbi:hypothetical protein [Agrobacterium leguminum]
MAIANIGDGWQAVLFSNLPARLLKAHRQMHVLFRHAGSDPILPCSHPPASHLLILDLCFVISSLVSP